MKDFRSIVTEGKEFPVDIIARVAKMTARNDHTGARLLVAKTLKNRKLSAAYEGLDAINSYFGHSPQSLIVLRKMLDEILFKALKNDYSNGQDIYMAM